MFGMKNFVCVPHDLLATVISTSAVSVPMKLLARQVQSPESSGSADFKKRSFPIKALPLSFFTQIISGFGVPSA